MKATPGNHFKRMPGLLLPFLLLAFSMLSQTGCGSSTSTGEQIKESFFVQASTSVEDLSPMPKVLATLPTSFKGAIQTQIKEAVPLEPDDKPGGEGPRHIYLGIDGDYANRVANASFLPGISVYDIEMFRKILVSQPAQLERFNESLEELKRLLNEKPDVNIQNDIEIVRYIEDKQVFKAHSRYVSFDDGHALLYLTQFNPDAVYVNNGALTYIVQGLTNDGRYYLFGTFPVRVGFLPENSDISDFEGYKIPMFTPTEAEAREHSRYLRKIETRLDKTPPGEFQPDLREIDKFISSIEIRNEQ